MKACWVSEGMAPRILDLGTGWTPRPLYPRERALGTNWIGGWVGPKSRPGHGGEEKNSESCRDSNHRS
jgi:hypothetical protein